jgi:acetolactate synthase I/II/III large subunit
LRRRCSIRSPIVCITGQVGSKLIGSDAFQEVDITGVTLPITKHNYLVTHASDVARYDPRGVLCGALRRPGPVLVDITKDAQQACEFDFGRRRRSRSVPGYRPMLSPESADMSRRLELIHNAKRPVILAGHGIIIRGR